MARAILGKKLGMTQAFDENGVRVPLTMLEAGPCVVVKKRTTDRDGYNALQVGFLPIEKRKVNKPVLGQLDGLGPFRYLRELPVDAVDEYEVGQEIKVDVFKKGDVIDVIGRSKGKGFQGTIKRHNFQRGPMTHGSKNKRPPGSIGMSAYPSRVLKGKRMPGHQGDERVTLQRLRVFDVDPEKNLLMIRGGIPGGRNGLVMVRATVKPKRSEE